MDKDLMMIVPMTEARVQFPIEYHHNAYIGAECQQEDIGAAMLECIEKAQTYPFKGEGTWYSVMFVTITGED